MLGIKNGVFVQLTDIVRKFRINKVNVEGFDESSTKSDNLGWSSNLAVIKHTS